MAGNEEERGKSPHAVRPHHNPRRSVAALHALQDLLHTGDDDLSVLYDRYLKSALTLFDMDAGVISSVKGDQFVFLGVQSERPVPFKTGDRWPLQSTFAQEVVRTGQTRLIWHLSGEARFQDHPLHRDAGFETYVGAPIRIGDTIVGTFSLLGTKPRDIPFTPEEQAFLELLANMLGRAIERHRLDIRRRAAEVERQDAMRLFTAAFDHAPIGMALVDLKGQFLDVNEAACMLFGYSEPQMRALTFQAITVADDLEADLDDLRRLLGGEIKGYRLKKRYVRGDGSILLAQLDVTLVRNEDGSPRCFVSQIQDIGPQTLLLEQLNQRGEELQAANRKLTELATVDPLTGILNRRALRQHIDDELQAASASKAPLAFVMFDVDHFKTYNDRFGHLEGDHALKAIADILRDGTRASDTIGRFGGEEFLVLLPRTGEAVASAIAERIRARTEAATGLLAHLTISAGIHVFDPEHEPASGDHSISMADAALYRAKHLGRNRVEVA
ncbi:diguanylate cyclase [Aquabacter sp. L1I39]|uniref:sensor domain-containing diguanylate cyclase n=1 Tax=Aquabacter sp. L1I39 TaxID=2820278 RepID=UPI001ADCC5D1|nr:sensor domain-containing diguanylate cyclase [Aquabacter sp. L1I39]QTL03361.1 diguanylate cyclase [Aquabacter sp. L1I39]